MKPTSELTDDEIDGLLLFLFEGTTNIYPPEERKNVRHMTIRELRQIRSKNHPDKTKTPDLVIYRAATEELARRKK